MQHGMCINNCWQPGEADDIVSINPVSRDIVWSGQQASVQQIREAVIVARAAFAEWRLTPFDTRKAIITRYADIVSARKASLTELIAKETGKPLWESATEVSAMIGKIEASLKAYRARTADTSHEQAGITTTLRHHPHGVIAVLGPFNFPGHLPNGHIVPALLAGNTVVFKASEYTPAVAEEMMRCWLAAELPNGVLNLLQGDYRVGEALAQADIDGLYFTGSFKTGAALHRAYAGHPEKILALEMGGNNPLVVYDCEDNDAAIVHTVQSAFITAGQRCTCARRLILQDNAAGNAFLSRLVTVTRQLLLGHYNAQPAPFMGALISAEAGERALDAQAQWQALGGQSLLPLAIREANTGLVSPGIIDMTGCHAPDDEIFAPLLQVYKVSCLESALALANNTAYGLSAGLLSQSKAVYNYFYQHIRAGIVNWNRPTTGASSSLPFGGIGHSGNHRPSAFYAADYCAFPVAGQASSHCRMPDTCPPGIRL